MKHQTISICNDNGAVVLAQAPLIISEAEPQTYRRFIPTGFSVGLKKVMSGGGILSRGRIAMFHLRIPVSLFSGRKILRLCYPIYPRLKSGESGVIYNILLMITRLKGWNQMFPLYSSG